MMLDENSFQSDYLDSILEAIILLSKNERSILILGESGTGKRVIFDKILSSGFKEHKSDSINYPKLISLNPSTEDLYKIINSKLLILLFNSNVYYKLDDKLKNKIDEKIYDKITLEPLRNRKSEIISNIEAIKNLYNIKIDKFIEDFLINFSYPGNIDHWNLLTRYIINHPKLKLPNEIPYTLIDCYSENSDILIPGKSMSEYEKAIIKLNLKYFKNNRKKTAESLGISERNLYRKLIIHKIL